MDIFCSILGYLYMNPIEINKFLGWFMLCNTTFNIISVILYCGGQFYCWRKPEYPEKITNLSQVTEKLYHIMGFELTTSVVIDTGCIGSCKSNYHTIMTTMAPKQDLYHIMGFELTTSVVIDTGCIGSCKSNYHTIMTTMAPKQDLYHIMGFELTTSVVIDTGCIGSCKSNYHTIMTTTAPKQDGNKQLYIVQFWEDLKK